MAIRRQSKKSSAGGAPKKNQAKRRKSSGAKKSASPGGPRGKKRPAGRKTATARPSRKNDEPGDRLQKILAAAGFGSRRACEELILEGRVEVDRQPVTELGVKADPATQKIRVDGEVLRKQKLVYYAAYKPKGVISTSSDPSGRARVTDLVPDQVRVFTVGRLDRESEGLVLLTNDGELANKLTHPRHGVEKIYQVQVAGKAEWENVKQLQQGVYLAEGRAKVKHLKIIKQHKQSTLLEMILDEGKNREIRRVLARLGHKVQHLKRVAIGTLRLAMMQPGEYRPLKRQEIRDLQDLAAGLGAKRNSATQRGAAKPQTERKRASSPKATGRKKSGTRTTTTKSHSKPTKKKARSQKPGPQKPGPKKPGPKKPGPKKPGPKGKVQRRKRTS